MDFETIKAIKESPVAQKLVGHIKESRDSLRDSVIDKNLPAPEYKIVALGKELAIDHLSAIIKEIDSFEDIEEIENDQEKDEIYYGHE